MSDNNSKNRYDEQRELLSDTFTAIGQKAEIILSVGQLLMENGASSDRIVRVTKRVAAFMGIDEKKFHLHIMFSTLMPIAYIFQKVRKTRRRYAHNFCRQ